MNGIYGYWDNIKGYVAYIGKDSYIDDNNNRDKVHNRPSAYNVQSINRAVQNNPERYEYFVLTEGDFSDKELNEMESQAIAIFKTFKYDYPERSVFNFTKGGDGSTGFKASPETKKLLSELRSGENNPMYGVSNKPSMDTLLKRSAKNNSTGFFRVHVRKHDGCSQGFHYVYKYVNNGKPKTICRVSLKELEEEVKNRNLEWIIVDEDKAKKTINIEANKTKRSPKNNSTGFLYVTIKKDSSYKKGFKFVYVKREDGKRTEISRVSLKSLEEEVKRRGLEWKILDEDKARETLKLDKRSC